MAEKVLGEQMTIFMYFEIDFDVEKKSERRDTWNKPNFTQSEET